MWECMTAGQNGVLTHEKAGVRQHRKQDIFYHGACQWQIGNSSAGQGRGVVMPASLGTIRKPDR